MAGQLDFFASGATLTYEFRRATLEQLRRYLHDNETLLQQALQADLGKGVFEAYGTEIGLVYKEINFALKHLHSWMKLRRVRSPLLLFPSSSFISPTPLGVILIIAPWNYPAQLTLMPLVGAIAAGNCVTLKPSEHAPRTAEILATTLGRHFPRHVIRVEEGGVATTQNLLKENWHHIFFTGSTAVGAEIEKQVAGRLIPLTLELGGKSPCVVDKSCDLPLAAKRIMWGKILNAGQSCVAPDYVLVEETVKKNFLAALEKACENLLGNDPRASNDYGRIISDHHFHRLKSYLNQGSVAFGGQYDENQRYIAPTVLESVGLAAPVMQEEIFGPILPVLGYGNLEEALAVIKSKPAPLAFYLFSNDPLARQHFFQQLAFGGGCINDTMMHLANSHLPFGGVGLSGKGAYHGRFSFDRFSHQKSIVKALSILDLPLRYPPAKGKLPWLRFFFEGWQGFMRKK